MKLLNRNNIFLLLVAIVYSFLTILCFDHVYFWDNIQQISKEAHWFYLTDFRSLLMPGQNSGGEIVATGYHPPLMGIMTAVLWKIVGYELWVSHVFVFFWFLILIFNVWKMVKLLFPEKFVGWVLLIVLMESTLLAQFSVASPDFILFTAFIISLRAVLEQKPWLLAVGLFFLCCINMRGIFVGAILFFVHYFYTYLQSGKKIEVRSFLKMILPYLPTLFLLTAYFIYYFSNNGWFFSSATNSQHYAQPESSVKVMKHLTEFVLRSVENGRIVIWLIGIYVAFLTLKFKLNLSTQVKVLLLLFLLLTGLYVLFIFITQMPFSGRYFMPQFFLLTLLVLLGITKFFEGRKLTFLFLLVLCFELTGHFWIYPEKIAKSWDCTLANLPYFELRKECFDYIDLQNWNYQDISAGFCLYGDRRFIELKTEKRTVGSDTNSRFFIYSNISNLEDEFVTELKNQKRWKPIKTFQNGMVFITIYQNKYSDNVPK